MQCRIKEPSQDIRILDSVIALQYVSAYSKLGITYRINSVNVKIWSATVQYNHKLMRDSLEVIKTQLTSTGKKLSGL